MKHVNSWSIARNIYIVSSQLMIVTEYHKPQPLTNALKAIPRFVPSFVGQMMVIYQADVLPFVRFLRCQLDQPIDLSHWTFLWADDRGVPGLQIA